MAREKRKQLRRYLEYRALIDFEDGSPVRACLLADVSKNGARLKLDAPGTLPNQFVLLLAGAGNVRRRCDVVWRAGRQLGVRFLPPSDEPPLCLSVVLDA
jgi:PilZ domain-containing protein